MKAKRVYEFQRTNDVKDALDVGDIRYTRDAQVWLHPTRSNMYKVDKDTKRLTSAGSRTYQYWIVFPEINYRGNITFGKKVDGQTYLVNDPKEAENAGIHWHRKQDEEEVNLNITEILEDYFLENFEDLMDDAKRSSRDEYIDMQTI